MHVEAPVDLTALFLNLIPPDQRHNRTPEEPVDEPFDRVQTGLSQRQTRLGEQQILKLVSDYLAGSSITQLVKEFNLNRNTVYEHLKRADVPRRSGKLTPAQVVGLRTQHENGVSITELAAQFGVSASTIQRRLADAT